MTMKRRHMNNGWALFLLMSAILVCITSVAAETYTSGDANSNGEYQIVLTVNPDGSQTLSYAGVVGGEITPHGEENSIGSGSIESDVEQEGTDTVQNLNMDGAYGYALLSGVDADGNMAAVETGFTNSEFVHVLQVIGNAIHSTVGTSEPVEESSGIEAFQHIWSPAFDSIYSNGYATNADGSSAIVSANAHGGLDEPDKSRLLWKDR